MSTAGLIGRTAAALKRAINQPRDRTRRQLGNRRRVSGQSSVFDVDADSLEFSREHRQSTADVASAAGTAAAGRTVTIAREPGRAPQVGQFAVTEVDHRVVFSSGLLDRLSPIRAAPSSGDGAGSLDVDGAEPMRW
jgi:Zn-dependent protease with chaperone function